MKTRAPNNRTLTLEPDEIHGLLDTTISLDHAVKASDIDGLIIHQDLFEAADHLPEAFVDLMIIDPPYNLTKNYNGVTFSQKKPAVYEEWMESWLLKLLPALKPTASIYLCCDWQTSQSIHTVLQKHLIIRNRITWEREKGRGAKANWKNCSEDIWFCTAGKDYYFNVDAVKLKRKVLAPYRDGSGDAKDWSQTSGGKFRLTHPSNLWTDISIPFWSMPENTDHPTQKPEKLIAKLIMASSNEGDMVFDPFLGSGTTAVVAKKLGRRFSGVEMNDEYCCMGLKRLQLAELNPTIQGYHDGCFWERNSLADQRKPKRSDPDLFGHPLD